MIRAIAHIFMFLILTVLTQIGGLAWLASRLFKRSFLAFVALYIAASIATIWIAPQFGRVPLSCGSGNPLQMQSMFYCALNRHYVVPELKETLTDLGTAIDAAHPGTITQVLDANFPFWTGFPLLPHLSHDDGRKVDIAFFYQSNSVYQPKATRSPIGYFAFEQGPTDCPRTSPTLRWDLNWLQSLWPKMHLDHSRMITAINWLTRDVRVEKLFVEPHLRATLGVAHPKIRFQGCRAARHDDHIHFQI